MNRRYNENAPANAVTITFQVSAEHKRWLVERAEAEHCSFSAILRRILADRIAFESARAQQPNDGQRDLGWN